MNAAILPAHALLDDGPVAADIPVCDHYCGTEARMLKAMALQAELGPVFDITLDCEDGAPLGAEAAHATLCADLALSEHNRFGRIGARVHPLDHPAFADDVRSLVGRAGHRLAYLMLPKPRHLTDVRQAIAQIRQVVASTGHGRMPPLHALIETHGGLQDVAAIAALPEIESLSFGLMDFVSAHRGAIPQSAMGVQGQFSHPLVLRAKLEIAAACHAAGKVPSHCVVTEFKNEDAIAAAARRAAREFGYTRMWSIHPAQIEPIVEAFSPSAAEVDEAIDILLAAQAAHWAPISHHHHGQDQLHDRASFRYYWTLLGRARRTGQPLPAQAEAALFGT